jgi:hypothetical protein
VQNIWFAVFKCIALTILTALKLKLALHNNIKVAKDGQEITNHQQSPANVSCPKCAK